MYKLVIADDEDKLRRGLCKFVDWGNLGFEVVGSFEDGKDTIDYLSTQSVDVVLTDIKMTELSGLDVAKYVFENKLRTRVVIISGFKEFEYAKKAIEYDIESYLLKPTDIDEICRVFTELKQKLDIELEKEHKQLKEKEFVEELIPIVREQFFIDLVMGTINTKEEIEQRLRLIGMYIDASNTCCCIISMQIMDYDRYIKEKWAYGKEQLNMALRNILQDKSGDILYFIVSNHSGYLQILAIDLKPEVLDRFKDNVTGDIKEVVDSINTFFGLAISNNSISFYNNLFDLNLLYKSSFIIEENLSITDNDSLIVEQFKLILSKITIGDNKVAYDIFKSFLDEVEQLPFEYQQKLVNRFIDILSEKYSESGVDYQRIASNRFSFTENLLPENLEKFKNMNKDILTDIFEGVSESTIKSTNIIIQKVKEYIETYYDHDISLDDIAEHVFLNPIYLSRFFKKQTGEKFIDYLIKIRMNKAINLLMENKYKVYEISKMVGYKSDKYFTRLFKQYTGYSPKEYPRSLMKVGEAHDQR